MKNQIFLLLVLLFSINYIANAQDSKYQIAIVSFYNLENIFDTINNPEVNDEEFTPEGKNSWTGERYKMKLSNMAKAISKIGSSFLNSGPTLLGISEIENIGVIQDLINTPPLSTEKYGIVHYDSPDKRGVDVGFIYQKDRFKVIGSKAFPLKTNDTSFFTRDQLLVKGLLDGEEIYVLVNHWPSRSGGEARSAPKRIAAAKLSRSIYDSLYNENNNVKFIIMGDLNDDPTDESLKKHLIAKCKLKDIKAGDLFNPMFKLFKDGIGSLSYNDSWNLFDQIIVSSPLTDKDYSNYKLHKAFVFNEPFLTQQTGQYQGSPFRTFSFGTFINGFSDHYPTFIILARKPKN